LTLYLYLNDIENGGGTNFDKLHITVMPRRGRALLWPSVLDSDPNVRDMRTTHQALPVGKDSLKYGANVSFFVSRRSFRLNSFLEKVLSHIWIVCLLYLVMFRLGFTSVTSRRHTKPGAAKHASLYPTNR